MVYVEAGGDKAMQIVGGTPIAIKVRKACSSDGITESRPRIIRKLIPVRDAPKAQETDRPLRDLQARLRIRRCLQSERILFVHAFILIQSARVNGRIGHGLSSLCSPRPVQSISPD